LYYQQELQDYDRRQEIVRKTTRPKDHAQTTNTNVDKKEKTTRPKDHAQTTNSNVDKKEKTTRPKDHAQTTNSNVNKKESEFWKQVRSTARAFTRCHPIQPQLGARHR
jgi:hypothetical protein